MPSVFTDKSTQPGPALLAKALGKSNAAWVSLCADLEGLALEWKFYGVKHGWQLKALKGNRSILYLIPGEGSFIAALALKTATLPLLPAGLREEVEQAKPGPEGHPARVQVKTRGDLQLVKKLVALKLEAA